MPQVLWIVPNFKRSAPSAIFLLTLCIIRSVLRRSPRALSASLLFIPNLAKDLGANNTQIGIIVAVYALAMFAASRALFLQVFADPYFVTPVLADPWLLALVRGLVGFSLGIYPAALTVYVYDSAGVVGRFSSLGALGLAVGTFVAGLVPFYYGIFALSCACYLLAFLISFTIKRVDEPRLRVPFFPKDLLRRNWRVYVSFMLRHVGANSIWVTFPLFIISLGGDRFWIAHARIRAASEASSALSATSSMSCKTS